MGVYPAQDHEIFGVAIIKDVGFVDHFTCVRGRLLFGYYKSGYEKCVRDKGAAQDAAGFEITSCIMRGDGQETLAEIRRDKDRAEWGTIFKVSRGFECESGWLEI